MYVTLFVAMVVRISVRSQVSHGNSFAKENLLGAKIAPTAVSRTFIPLLRETGLP